MSTEWTGYYTYDPRGSVSGVTDNEGMIWQSYRYNANGDITFGKPQYNNVYSYNAESYNPNMESQYLRARYYNVTHTNFLTEDSYLGNITDPLTLNRYNYVKSSPLNYQDSSGHDAIIINKPMDAFTPIDHMSALFQDENGDWSFFYWGPDVEYKKVDGSVLSDPDSLNKYLLENNLNERSDRPYNKSVYIKGDFTASDEGAKELVKYFDSNNKGNKYFPYGIENERYKFVFNNCSAKYEYATNANIFLQ